MYPRVPTDLRLPSRQLVTFLLVDGQIVYEHRYHRHLCAAQARARPKERRGLMATLSPSHIGAHSGSPLLTIREGFRFLEIQCSVEYAKNEVGLNLKEVILGYIAMRWTSICAHPVTDNMDPFKYAPLATSIASPSAAGRLGVAMTRWNPVAQFSCCENGIKLSCKGSAVSIVLRRSWVFVPTLSLLSDDHDCWVPNAECSKILSPSASAKGSSSAIKACSLAEVPSIIPVLLAPVHYPRYFRFSGNLALDQTTSGSHLWTVAQQWAGLLPATCITCLINALLMEHTTL